MVAAERRQSKHVIDIVWFMCSKSVDGHCTITECFRSLHPWTVVRGWRGWVGSRQCDSVHRQAVEREGKRKSERTWTRCLLRISNFRYWQPNESSYVAYPFLPSLLLMYIRFLSWFSTAWWRCLLAAVRHGRRRKYLCYVIRVICLLRVKCTRRIVLTKCIELSTWPALFVIFIVIAFVL